MATDSGIDPRYAAQFQRGFDPAQHVVEAPPRRRGPVPIDSAPAPVVQRIPTHPPVVERPVVIAPAAEAPSPDTEDDPDQDLMPVGRPRAEWALLVGGVGILLVAVSLFFGAVDASTNYQGPGPELADQLFSFATAQLPGPLVLVGTIALCTWAALRVLHPERGPR